MIKLKELWLFSGIFPTITGILHAILALAVKKDAIVKIFRNGHHYADFSCYWLLYYTCFGCVAVYSASFDYYFSKKTK
jgi:hypothetical protein